MSQGYTNIPDWMLAFDLDVYETIILAVIYGFSQDGDSTFKGSQNYLANKAKCSRAKVARTLPKLVEMGLLEKIENEIRGVKLCEYRVCLPDTGCISQIQGLYPTDTGCISETHKNIDKNNSKTIVKESNPLSLPYDSQEFKETWKILCQQPKWKKKSQSALQLSLKKLSRYPETVAIKMMEESIANDWQGLFPPKEQQGTPNRKESVYEHNMKVMSNLLGK